MSEPNEGKRQVGWDRAVFWQMNHLSADTPWAHAFVAAYALWAGPVALTLVFLACWWGTRRRDDACRSVAAVVLTGVAAVLALAVNQVIGPAVGRVRPFAAMPHVLMLLPHTADSSFPSDHAMIAGALAAGLLLVHRGWGVLAGVLALLLAASRVYVGVHYPTDVLGGLAIGAGIAVLSILCLRGLLARPLAALSGTAVHVLVTASRRDG